MKKTPKRPLQLDRETLHALEASAASPQIATSRCHSGVTCCTTG